MRVSDDRTKDRADVHFGAMCVERGRCSPARGASPRVRSVRPAADRGLGEVDGDDPARPGLVRNFIEEALECQCES